MGNHVIRDRIWVSDKLSRCSLPAALAFPWVFLICDDWGRFEYRPRAIWGQVFGSREDVSVEDVKAWLTEYERAGLLVRYHIDGDLAYWTGFEGRPENRRRKSRYPDPKAFVGAKLSESATVPRETAQDRTEMLPLAEYGAEQSRDRAEAETEHVTGSVETSGFTDEQRQEWAAAVWEAFQEHSGDRTTRLMSPSEWATLKGWMDRGIPLRVILRGIRETRGKGGKLLTYYNSSVLAAHEHWRQSLGATA